MSLLAVLFQFSLIVPGDFRWGNSGEFMHRTEQTFERRKRDFFAGFFRALDAVEAHKGPTALVVTARGARRGAVACASSRITPQTKYPPPGSINATPPPKCRQGVN